MEYNFREIEQKWRQHWKDTNAYKVSNKSEKPKYYVLDMFPYPSGAGLHVGHPLGYIASDIFSRYKRLKGYNVLHPMGFDSFGLPAEQYALDTGQHPAVTTRNNIATFKKQLDNIGFCFDWSRELKTSDASFYKWTQWIFLQLFESFFNRQTKKAEPISTLVDAFEKEGNRNHPCPGDASLRFSADEWENFDEPRKRDVLMQYRLSYCGYGEVNWCEALGTVLANDEVVNGVSERGGYPVVKKKLRQWYLRITEYADRLLEGLEKVEFSDAMKEMQTNWIGKSSGAEIDFQIKRPPYSAASKSQDSAVSKSQDSAPSKSPPSGETWEKPGYFTADPVTYHHTKGYSKENRSNPTKEENLLWQALRNHKTGHHIRRQHIIDSYIVDFVCLDKLVTIEVDGDYHNEPEAAFNDKSRTSYLNEKGYIELRFSNEEIKNDIEKVVESIKQLLDSRPSISKGKGNLSALSKVSPEGGDLEGAERGDLEGDERGNVERPERSNLSASSKVSPEGGDLEGAERGDLEMAEGRDLEEGKSEDLASTTIRVYTTRPDTIFGVDFMVIAPEHDLVASITSEDQQQAVNDYIAYVKSRSERERMAEKKITGVFTGSFALNPFNGREIPIWISEYVLAGYGTGAIMAVPCGDERDHKFANHFNIPITNIIGKFYNGEEANPTRDAFLENSGFLNGIKMKDAIGIVIDKIEELGIGIRKVNYKMRDAAFSRQRYWGEPFPIKWINGVAYPLPASELPLELPHVDSYKPGPEGEGPLANIEDWTSKMLETNTMPGYAGSSWYFLRYMDPENEQAFCDRKASDYWGQVDVYIGGTEHAVGHLLYSRMWTKALYDLGFIGHDEPYKKLVNQGMIQGSSRLVFRVRGTNQFVSAGLKEQYETDEIHVDVNIVDGVELDIEAFKKWRAEYGSAEFILENGVYYCGTLVEKMSKRLFNTVNPDDLVAKYGADTFRMYEMFLGPVEMSKPWDTKGIEGVHRFLKKLWRLFYDEMKGKVWTDEKPNDAELKVLHKTIKQIEEVTERFSFNTGVSGFMIAVNELHDLKCYKKEILGKLLILLTPYAPHIAEELWQQLGNSGSILDASFPAFEAKYVQESSKEYPISVNGKLRTTLDISLEATQTEVEQIVLANDIVKKWLDGKPHKKIIYVKNKMVNVVV